MAVCFTAAILNAQTTTINKVYIPRTGQTLFSKIATYTESSTGTTLSMSGMLEKSSGGTESPIIQVPGNFIDIRTDQNGSLQISCRPANATCFEINCIANYPLENLNLINQTTTHAVVATKITVGIVNSSLMANILNVTQEGDMAVSRFTDFANKYQTGGGQTVLGYVANVHQIGNTWIVQCDPGPGWCLRYITLPAGVKFF